MTLKELKESCEGWNKDAYGALYFTMEEQGLDFKNKQDLGREILKELDRVYWDRPKTLNSMKTFFKTNLDI